MDLLIVLLCIVGVLGVAALVSRVEQKKKVKAFERKLRSSFGTFERKEPNEEKMKPIRGYFFKHLDDEEFFLDDITWNDLEGDVLFSSVNKCYSSCGEEILYNTLRKPKTSIDEKAKEKNISQVEELKKNEDLRVKLQLIFATLGKTGRHSVYEYISLLSNVKSVPLILFFVDWIGYVLIFLLFFVNVPLAITVLVLWAIASIIFSLTKKSVVEQYVTSFEYIVRTLITAESIIKENPEIYPEEVSKLKALRKSLKGINSSSLVFIQETHRSGTMDIMMAIMSLINSFLMIDLFIFYRMLSLVNTKLDEFDEIFAVLGGMEAQISVSNMRASFENVCNPTFTDTNGFEVKDISHPLVKGCVSNSFTTNGGMLITGSNASGKSTFLRTVLVNCVLSQSVYTAIASEFLFKPSFIYSSMALKDSLESGESYYMVEINSIKRILLAKEANRNVICFLDEVLRGTNTIERIAAASEILRNLSGENIECFAATHDIELTYLLEENFSNFYFREEIKEIDGKEDIFFSYRLNAGRSDTRNALMLLKIMGYPPEVVENAQTLAHKFYETGKWN